MTLSEPLRGINDIAYQKCMNIILHLVLPHPLRMKDKEFYLYLLQRHKKRTVFCTKKVVLKLGIRTNKHPRNGQMDKLMDKENVQKKAS